MKRAFTLIELLLVVAIMGLMGTISVGGFRAMRRGMEQRSILRNVSQFIRNAYQRAEIDRQTTAVFFWNEVKRDESDDGAESLIVVGRAVAVRQAGRVSDKDRDVIYDEFGDLKFLSETTTVAGKKGEGATAFIYHMSGDREGGQWEACQCLALQESEEKDNPVWNMGAFLVSGMSQAEAERHGENFGIYGYYLPDGTGNWERGDQYGFEIGNLTLPNNYIFGKNFDLKNAKISKGPQDARCAMWFYPKGEMGSGSHSPVTISIIGADDNGEPAVLPIKGETEDPMKE